MSERIQTQPPAEVAARRRRNRILEVDDVTMRFGGVTALDEVSFHINEGEILGLIGPERRRQDDLLQRDDRRLPADRRARSASTASRSAERKRFEITKLGIARTFQNIRLFADDDRARERHGRRRRPPPHGRRLGALFRPAAAPPGGDARAASAAHGAARVRRHRATGPTSWPRNLPYGDQRRLEIARALATEPKLLLPRRAGRRLQPGREGTT